MASSEKMYLNAPALLLNILYDIVEMRKAKITHEDEKTLAIDTEMYGIKTGFLFRVTPFVSGTSVSVETDGNDENAVRRVQLMFATLDNMIELFTLTKND